MRMLKYFSRFHLLINGMAYSPTTSKVVGEYARDYHSVVLGDLGRSTGGFDVLFI